ncbi:hypothetical protein CTAM01_17066 [Colletotrichum tamarilloi]|uniref:Uncharacterized protein n=1 Tax=Colletotrichum tamarilloi TaxID=1209934 RepID=A0ABQ9QGQ0_9PEZI|nr:hypothetical protein CTAM01_17066 [Colletotrichum tamarilloi]
MSKTTTQHGRGRPGPSHTCGR